ncbi:unnamed protein product [Cladocopium goreaui]|uniref:8-demethyl-8-(2,3-dimethoxy-alpha-L-rhamnosyl)-te tracenomycin-C 4'-O-methyltransferase (O-methyltransferas e III) n=1 Tax=Cladocopium goreaui TaxID=2562237 RepID=A0A9P1FQ34_9DINO|nr:unnamed protein product [Cladocopium goreaui]
MSHPCSSYRWQGDYVSWEELQLLPDDPWLANTRRQLTEHWPKITMTSEEKMKTTALLLLWLSKANIAGDVAEAGVWRGGHALFMKFAADHLSYRFSKRSRRVWLLDSFHGFGYENTGVDEVFNRVNNSADGWLPVIALFRGLNMLDSRVIFLRGFYEDSLPLVPNFIRFALLRVDCDMYSSIVQARRRGPRSMRKTPNEENVGDVWWQKTMESNVAKSSFCLEQANMKVRAADTWCTDDCHPACCI